MKKIILIILVLGCFAARSTTNAENAWITPNGYIQIGSICYTILSYDFDIKETESLIYPEILEIKIRYIPTPTLGPPADQWLDLARIMIFQYKLVKEIWVIDRVNKNAELFIYGASLEDIPTDKLLNIPK